MAKLQAFLLLLATLLLIGFTATEADDELVSVSVSSPSSGKDPTYVLEFFLHQQFGVSELAMIPAARPPVAGTRTGFGMKVVYEYPMTAGSDSSSKFLGFVRGTSVVVNNTLSPGSTFFVNNLVDYDDGEGLSGTFSQQGQAIFTGANATWEFAIVGGTGSFRNCYGYNVGKGFSVTPNPNGGAAQVVTQYEASIWYRTSD